MSLFLLSVFASVLGAFLYAMFINRHQEAIQKWIMNLPQGFFRKLYVRMVIGAVKGKAHYVNTLTLNIIPLVLPCLLLFYFIGARSDLNQSISYFQTMKSLTSEGFDQSPDLEQLSSDAKKLLKEGSDLSNRLYFYQFLILGWINIHVVFVMPFRVIRSRYSFELQRLLDYTRALSAKSEIVEIMIYEQKVTDEKTLKEFLFSLVCAAAEHDTLDCMFPLWIWGSSDPLIAKYKKTTRQKESS